MDTPGQLGLQVPYTGLLLSAIPPQVARTMSAPYTHLMLLMFHMHRQHSYPNASYPPNDVFSVQHRQESGQSLTLQPAIRGDTAEGTSQVALSLGTQ